MHNVVRATQKGQIVIPAEIRRKYHIDKGTKVRVEDLDGTIAVIPLLKDPVREARGIARGGKSALETLLADRAEEARR